MKPRALEVTGGFLTSLSSGMDLLSVHSWLLAIYTRRRQTETNSQ